MIRILILSLLLTIVYSWEDFKRTLKILFLGLLKRDPGYYYVSRLDQMVGTLILIATIPMGLTYFLVSDRPLVPKLAILAITLLIISFLAAASGGIMRWTRIARKTEGSQKIIPITLAIGGLFSPLAAVFSGAGSLHRSHLAKIALLLALPPLVGLVVKGLLTESRPPELLIPNYDALIVLLVGALIIRIVIEILERFFRLYSLERLFSYVRILLGIALAANVILGLV